MGILDRLGLTETTTPATDVAQLTEQLQAERTTRMLVEESYADLSRLYAEDQGWAKIGEDGSRLDKAARDRIALLADVMVVGNPLIKRGISLRTAYVWGQGVNVTVRDDGAEGQDVGAVLKAFWDDDSNQRELTGSEAQVRYERRLATRGEAFWILPTDKTTGQVWVRHIPAREVVDRVCNPDDAAEVWLYKRAWTAVVVDADGKRDRKDRVTWHPAVGFYPPSRPLSYEGKEIRWDAPMRPVTVNNPDEDWRGVGDALAAMPWARMDKEFLEDLAAYMRAMTRILAQVTSKRGPARAAAAKALAAAQPGGVAVTDPDTAVSMVSKSGAQIDADSHRPLATMVAAALEVPLTMLLGDPGITGARATAETLDQPTELTMGLRQKVHTALFRDIAGYVIDQAVIAPAGLLTGTVTKTRNRLQVVLPEGDDRQVVVDWPEFDSTPLKDLVAAIAAADGTGKMPPVETFKLLAKALGLEDLDDLLDAMTDDAGNWIDPQASAGAAAVESWRRGEDPAEVLA